MKKQVISKFKELYSGVIYDVMKFDLGLDNFVLPKTAGPIIPSWNFKGNVFGRAFTAVGQKTPKPDETIIRKMVDDLEEDVVYVLQANDNSRAHFGDIMCAFLKRAKVQGAVIQGWTRDISGIEDLDFKLWCKGVQPQDSYDRWHIVDYNCPIVIGNIFIFPTDFIFADRDGVLIIKEEQVEEILKLAEPRVRKEKKIRSLIETTNKSSTEIFEEIGRW